MIKITLKDGSIKELEAPQSAYEIAKGLSNKLAKVALCAKIDGEVRDLATVIDKDSTLEILTFEDDEAKKVYRHTASHILAQAVKRLYPNVKLTIGPAIENGFYYDFDSEESFSPEVLTKLEKEMNKIMAENLPIERFTLSREEAVKLMTERNEPYKVELINELPEGEEISFYRQGEFVDLCAGSHLMSTAAVKAVKLTQCTGAYWRGDANNKMLQRVYGTAFPKAEELKAYLDAVEEAKKRDHNKLGRELEYFTTVDSIGQGLPILLPKGARTIQRLQRWVEDTEEKAGYLLTKTPLMAKRDLYRISGHWDHYLDGMFILGDPMDETKECFALRPMTCPFQYQVYLNRQRSYRELPMRLGETSTLFRNEDSGEMHGLIRVRQFTISEGHLVLRPDQLEEEFKGCLDLAKYFLGTVGMLENCTFRFSQWDPANPNNKYEGTAEQWNTAQEIMGRILDNLGINYTIGIDEAAFYGPKLDIQYKNVFGKEDTIVTIQIDMLLAEKFGMYYIDENGEKKLPYIIHRTSLGCYERTLAYLIEQFAGAMPTWLSPLQVAILPISDRQHEFAEDMAKQLEMCGVRVEVDTRNEKIGYKIRQAQLEKTPYMLVIGDKEQQDGTVALRARGIGDVGVLSFNDFKAKLLEEISTKNKDITIKSI
ncbi:MAG: threonine--tRNA ligase [Ruminococcaceae bacterium]|nr:threonine--tRNA ligase [Oscillospiraceae bacterium]